ncbi:MAG: BLUF domain-containing protein [Pseudomonadota bacterium]
MLVTLSYVSRSKIGGDLGKLIALQNECIASNSQSDVSGVLYYDGEHFFQVIEGNFQTINDLYARICRDGRHYECRKLTTRTVHQRRFPGNPMKIISAISNPCMSSIVPSILADPRQDLVERRINDLAYA